MYFGRGFRNVPAFWDWGGCHVLTGRSISIQWFVTNCQGDDTAEWSCGLWADVGNEFAA